MPSLRDILPPIHTMGSYYQNQLQDICHQLWKCWRSWSSRYTVVERSNPHCYWYMLFGHLLTFWQFHKGTVFIQGCYAFQISILAQSKKIAAAIVAVSHLKNPRSERCWKFAWYTALFHSIWQWDHDWSLCKAEEKLHLTWLTSNGGPRRHKHCRMNNSFC